MTNRSDIMLRTIRRASNSLSLSLSLPLVIALIKRTLNFPRGRGRGWKNIRRNERVTIDKSE